MYAPLTLHENKLAGSLTDGLWSLGKLSDGSNYGFLKNLLGEEVYLKQPEGFVDQEHRDRVWRVRASLYSLLQSP